MGVISQQSVVSGHDSYEIGIFKPVNERPDLSRSLGGCGRHCGVNRNPLGRLSVNEEALLQNRLHQ